MIWWCISLNVIKYFEVGKYSFWLLCLVCGISQFTCELCFLDISFETSEFTLAVWLYAIWVCLTSLRIMICKHFITCGRAYSETYQQGEAAWCCQIHSSFQFDRQVSSCTPSKVISKGNSKSCPGNSVKGKLFHSEHGRCFILCACSILSHTNAPHNILVLH